MPPADHGLDSVAALSLCGDIEEDFDLVLEPTVAQDYPTVEGDTQGREERHEQPPCADGPAV